MIDRRRFAAIAAASIFAPLLVGRAAPAQALGSTLIGSTPEELSRYLKAEMAKWGPVIRDANISLDG